MAKRTFRQVMQDVLSDWVHPYFGAVPYIEALLVLDTDDPNAPYGLETAASLVRYFLANATSYKGNQARSLKTELKDMIK